MVSYLKSQGVVELYHFTNRSNLDSIHKQGLVSWSRLKEDEIKSTCGGDQTSRKLDLKRGLEDYVRLSFNRAHPMMFVCKSSGRVPDPVILQVPVEVVTQPGTLFSDRNATATEAIFSSSPEVDVALRPSRRHVTPELSAHHDRQKEKINNTERERKT